MKARNKHVNDILLTRKGGRMDDDYGKRAMRSRQKEHDAVLINEGLEDNDFTDDEHDDES